MINNLHTNLFGFSVELGSEKEAALLTSLRLITSVGLVKSSAVLKV